ncbi:serine/arginine repetitive matrix protein 1 [Brachypodium distachyon]|uniref:DUF4378 domain-containing protein n=1 Tax=Brachypodium distachyon TaxID=15368 RepID=A0A0Q3E626_BRADI|nr:serine/arginine repetitive matrix protein 1 [Brachypodium distachyon]KQJ81660.2 hypothetical protein BRADI_5g02140v3 [Brachypodium distachyon]|eukprot:XP_010240707.2 serine/arginine repetitive matrix protein 1 [Brachypodium distachyon]
MKKQHWYSRSRSVPASPRRGLPADAMANPGCMSMVHYLIFAPGAGCVGRPPSSDAAATATVNNSHHAIVSPPTATPCTKGGLEAPRNSLELEADELRDIQIGVQIEPAFDALAGSSRRRSTSSCRATAPSSEAETPRTPSLVARLMGIDGLPDSPSPSPGLKQPRPSIVKEKKKRVIPESMNKQEQPPSNSNRQPLRSLSCNVGAGDARSRSLPDTPRASTSSAVHRAAAWEEDTVLVDRPRLSLQVLKESVLDRAAQYMSMPNSPTKKKKKDESRRRDAKEHAREIVRQAKETVITNRSKTGSKLKPTSAGSDKENTAPYVAVEDKMVVAVQLQVQAGAPAPASAPRALADQQQQPHAPRLPPPPSLRAKPSRPPPPPPPPDHPTPIRAVAPAPLSPQAVKCKRPPDGCERFATRTIRKPGAGAAAAAATIHQAAPQASSSAAAPLTPASSSIGQHRTAQSAASSSRRGVPLPQEEDDPEYSYLRCVLERGGFMRTPPPNRPFKGHSVSSPIDPLVFHLLELDLPMDDEDSDNYHRLGPLRHRWNRKLLFHLAQEILADILLASTPLLILQQQQQQHGPALLGKVWRKVKAFPAADCRVVGDIDALVAGDLAAASVRGLARHPAVAEEAADVADDVAERLLDALLAESLPSSPLVAFTCTQVSATELA